MTKILAIDDNNDNLTLLESIIKNSFPEAIFDTALTGKKGIELAISLDPDVILLDIMMPDMDGFEVCRQLKEDQRMCDIPVVFLTAMKEDKENRINALQAGGEAFLYKPIDVAVFVAQIRAMLKIKEFNNQKRNVNESLSQLVAERTRELEQSHAETLKLLDEQKAENEKYRKTEEELRESEEKYRLLHESAGVGIGYYAPNGTIISYNTIAAINMNGKPEDFAGKSIYTLFPKEDADFYMDRIKKALTSELRQAYEDKVELPTEVKWFQSVFTRILDASNQVIGVQIISTDITEQKHSEAALKESESKFRMLFTQMSEGFALHELIYDANHNPVDYKILDINPAFEKQVGIRAEDAKGTLATQLYGVSPAPYIDIYAQVTETGEPQFFQTYFPPLDRHFQISVFSPYPGNFATVFTDITEVKRAEDALRQSEYQFKQLVDDMHVGVLLQGTQAEILLSNPTALELLGLTESQLLGKTSFDPDWNVIHEDGSPFSGSAHPVPQAIESRQSVRNVVMGVYRPTTQNRVWLQVDAEPQLNSQGMVQQVVCTFIDITERKKAEEALRETKNYLENLINYANAPIIVWDNNFRITQFNKAFERLSGRKELDVAGHSVEILFPAETRDQSLEYIKKTRAGERWEVVEIEIQDIEGNVHTLLWNSAAIYSLDGKTILATIAQGQNITKRKKAEAALTESETRFRSLLQNVSSVSVQGYDFDGNTQYWNRASEQLYGYTAEEAINRNLLNLIIPPEMKEGVKAAIAQMIETGEPIPSSELSLMRKDGSRVSVFSSHAIVHTLGGVPELFCIDIDLTDRRKAEEALKENEARLRELNATKDKFFSIIAHDLKNPFNGILGLSNILVEQIQEKNFDGVEEYATIIQKSSMRVYELLVNLLDWARSQTGRIEFSPQYFELGTLINEVAELLNDSALQKSITIFKELPRNMLVSADKAMISTVLRNLITNAIKFTHPGGQILISADKKPDELTISISDNGIGIKKESIGKLFRIDENHITVGTQNEKGTGLGLILCKEFIEKHSGKIWAESELGKGSKFFFTIPKN